MERVISELNDLGVKYKVNRDRDVLSLEDLAICADPAFGFFWLGKESGTGDLHDVLKLVGRLYG